MKQIIIQPTIDKLIRDNNIDKLNELTAGEWDKIDNSKEPGNKTGIYYVKQNE